MSHTHNAAFYVLNADTSPGFNPGAAGGRVAIVGGTQICYFWTAGTTWQRIDIGALSAADGNDFPIVRANATQNVAPSGGEIPSPVDGDTASVFLTNGMLEKWVRQSGVWVLAYTLQSDLASNLAIGTNNTTTLQITNTNGTGLVLAAATNLLAGLLSAADKTKLDFISITQAVDLDAVESNVNALVTLSGVAANATDLGTFSGSTISDNLSIKAALQLLETALEAAYINSSSDTNSIDLDVTGQTLTANVKIGSTQDLNYVVTISANGLRLTRQTISSYVSRAAAQADGGLAVGKEYFLNVDNIDGIATAGTAGPAFFKI